MPVTAGWHIMAPPEGTMEKTRLNIYLNPQQKEKLDKLSEKTGAPLSELIRRAIDLYLKKES
jgi:predicted DNA-binding protein